MSDLVIIILSQMIITMMAVSAVNYHTTRIATALAKGLDSNCSELINEIRRGNYE